MLLSCSRVYFSRGENERLRHQVFSLQTSMNNSCHSYCGGTGSPARKAVVLSYAVQINDCTLNGNAYKFFGFRQLSMLSPISLTENTLKTLASLKMFQVLPLHIGSQSKLRVVGPGEVIQSNLLLQAGLTSQLDQVFQDLIQLSCKDGVSFHSLFGQPLAVLTNS